MVCAFSIKWGNVGKVLDRTGVRLFLSLKGDSNGAEEAGRQ